MAKFLIFKVEDVISKFSYCKIKMRKKSKEIRKIGKKIDGSVEFSKFITRTQIIKLLG